MPIYRYRATNLSEVYYSYDDGESFLVKYDTKGNIVCKEGDESIMIRYYDELFRMLLRVRLDALAV
ncbi:MAG: hypothetical protein ABIH66_08230 [bacterium]